MVWCGLAWHGLGGLVLSGWLGLAWLEFGLDGIYVVWFGFA